MKKPEITMATIASVIILTIAATLVALPITSAHDPPINVKTYAYVTVTPNPVGVNQELLILMWINRPLPTGWGQYGDRWENLTVEFTKPDGSKETIGPYTTDPAATTYGVYTPDQVGTWTLKFIFPGQTIVNKNPPPPIPEGALDARRLEYIGDYFEPSSAEITFKVQEDPAETFQAAPLPEGYWDRPINAQHQNWWPISGNVVSFPRRFGVSQVPQVNQYSTGPESAHILWTREHTIGGLVGGEFGSHSYHCGSAYEGKLVTVIIINGVLYYNKYPQNLKYHPPATYTGQEPKPGYYAVDLRTGEELYYNNATRISTGQIYYYSSPNQHGAFAYLWKTPETAFRVDTDPNWYAYDAYTGDYVCTIINPLGGLSTFGLQATTDLFIEGPNGEILSYVLDTNNHWLALWNNTAIPELLAGKDYYAWMWRPYGKTVDGSKGYSWNVTIPVDVQGTINYVLDDRIIGSSGLAGLAGMGPSTTSYTVWALSLKSGEEGKLLWKKNYEAPDSDVYVTMTNAPASSEEGVFFVRCAETNRWYAYSTENGEFLWETETESAWNYYYETNGEIAYHRLYTTGMSGRVYAYDIETGEIDWTYDAVSPAGESVAPNYHQRLSIIADGKIYVSSTEHSPGDPKSRGNPIVCLDAETGEKIWDISYFRSSWGCEPLLADGIIVGLDTYDNRIYAFGTGASKTTATAPKTAIPLGSSVVIEGTVTDQSPGTQDYSLTARYPNGVPAIADQYMTEWMEHLYRQFSIPKDATGVEVVITTLDPNGNTYELDRTTTDLSGTFGCAITPPVPGLYKIIVTFEGSDSYYGSYAETYICVEEASSPAQAFEPELTAPEPTEPSEAPLFSATDLAIIAAVAVAVVIGVASYWTLRRRK